MLSRWSSSSSRQKIMFSLWCREERRQRVWIKQVATRLSLRSFRKAILVMLNSKIFKRLRLSLVIMTLFFLQDHSNNHRTNWRRKITNILISIVDHLRDLTETRLPVTKARGTHWVLVLLNQGTRPPFQVALSSKELLLNTNSNKNMTNKSQTKPMK